MLISPSESFSCVYAYISTSPHNAPPNLLHHWRVIHKQKRTHMYMHTSIHPYYCTDVSLYMYMCVYLCVYTCIHNIPPRPLHHLYMHVCTYVYVHPYIMHLHVHLNICIVLMCLCICVYLRMYAYIHPYILPFP